VYFRITIANKRLEPPRSTGVRASPKQWVNQKVKNDNNASLILDAISYKLKTIHASQIVSGKEPSLQSVMGEYDGKSRVLLFELAEMFFSYCENYLINNPRLDEEELKHPSTIKTYRYKFEHIRRYYLSQQLPPPQAQNFDAFEVAKIVDWLRIESDIYLQRATIARVLTVVKKVISYGYKNGYLEMDKIKGEVGEERYANGKYALASEQFDAIISNPVLEEFLTLRAYELLD